MFSLAVPLGNSLDTIASDVLSHTPRHSSSHSSTVSVFRVSRPAPCVMIVFQLSFLGGRLAIRRALDGMKDVTAAASSQAILHNQDGAPVLPEGVSASISHKNHLAVALVQSGCEGHLGKQRLHPE